MGQVLRPHSAVALGACEVFRIERSAMLQALDNETELSNTFIAFLIARNNSLEDDLCDHLFNKTDKRLARALLKLSRFGQTTPDVTVSKVSHGTLAEMVGSSRERVTQLMNKFRKLGLVEYNNQEITMRTSLLTDLVLKD